MALKKHKINTGASSETKNGLIVSSLTCLGFFHPFLLVFFSLWASPDSKHETVTKYHAHLGHKMINQLVFQ